MIMSTSDTPSSPKASAEKSREASDKALDNLLQLSSRSNSTNASEAEADIGSHLAEKYAPDTTDGEPVPQNGSVKVHPIVTIPETGEEGQDKAQNQVPKRFSDGDNLQVVRSSSKRKSILESFSAVEDDSGTLLARMRLFFLITLLLQSMVLAMSTLDGPHYNGSAPAFDYLPSFQFYENFDYALAAIFSLEIAVRFYSSTRRRLLFRKWLTWVDIICTGLLWIKIMNPTDGFWRLQNSRGRIVRLFRVVDMARFFYGSTVLTTAIKKSVKPLMITMFFLAVLSMIFATLLFYLDPCLDRFECPFTDIFNAGYYVITTVTTVGYGDQIPTWTRPGAVAVAVISMVIGSLFLAMPLAIIGNKFQEEWRKHELASGRTLDDEEKSKASRSAIVRTRRLDSVDIVQSENDRRMWVSCIEKWHNIQVNFFNGDEIPIKNRGPVAAEMFSFDMSNRIRKVLSLLREKSSFTSHEAVLQVDDPPTLEHVTTLNSMLIHWYLHLTHQLGKVSDLLSRAANSEARFGLANQENSKNNERNSVHLLTAIHNASLLHATLEKALDHLALEPIDCHTPESEEVDRTQSKIMERLRSTIQKERDGHEDDVKERMKSKKIKDRLWLLLEDPHSSKSAHILDLLLLFFVIVSIGLFFSETMPEMHVYGRQTPYCKHVVKLHCTGSERNKTMDPGCFQTSPDDPNNMTKLVDFECPEAYDTWLTATPSYCYEYGLNYGDLNNPNWTCNDAFKGLDANSGVCNRVECNDKHKPMFDASIVWPGMEMFFGVLFTAEIIVRCYIADDRLRYFRSPLTIIDIVANVPFYVEIFQVAVDNRIPDYAIVPSNPSFLSLMRMFKTIRVLKLTRHFSGTIVLVRTFMLSWHRLTVPLFFLGLATVFAAGIWYELERGQECFVGQPCTRFNVDIWKPEFIAGKPIGKRILIQEENVVMFNNMARSLWVSIVTLTSVGYGRMHPRTPLGKLFGAFVGIFGAFYTAMPLSLVGAQFYECYEMQEKNMNLSSRDRIRKLTTSGEGIHIESILKPTLLDRDLLDRFRDLGATLQDAEGALTSFFGCILDLRESANVHEFKQTRHLVRRSSSVVTAHTMRQLNVDPRSSMAGARRASRSTITATRQVRDQAGANTLLDDLRKLHQEEPHVAPAKMMIEKLQPVIDVTTEISGLVHKIYSKAFVENHKLHP